MVHSSRSRPSCEVRSETKRSRYGTVAVGEPLLPRLKAAVRSTIVVLRTTQLDEGSGDMCLNLIDTDPETRTDPVIGKIVKAMQNEHLARDRWQTAKRFLDPCNICGVCTIWRFGTAVASEPSPRGPDYLPAQRTPIAQFVVRDRHAALALTIGFAASRGGADDR